MGFDLDQALQVLERTPGTLDRLLRGLAPGWTEADEGPGSWSPRVVLGHLIHGEETDWIPRARIILEAGEARAFEPFDRFAQLSRFAGWEPAALLDRFAELREANLATLRGWRLGQAELAQRGRHPELGAVTLGELLATWAVHDLNHLVQVSRAMARRWQDEVGPWRAYLGVLTPPPRRPETSG